MSVIRFDNSVSRYRDMASAKLGNGDYAGALSLLFTALKSQNDVEVYADIADVYAEMGLYEMSNQYWFLFLDKAPKSKRSIAYKELAVNFFYMDNFLLSGYYFNLKIKTDGVLGQDGLPDEVLDFFSQEGKDNLFRDAYRVVYPIDRTDYSPLIREAKRLIAHGYFDKVEGVLEKIPKESEYYKEALDNLAVATFVAGDAEKAKKLNKELISVAGENILAYCNLSSIYNELDNEQKSKYYFEKASKLPLKDENEAYKLAVCALEQNRADLGVKYLKKVLDGRNCDINTKYLYALALINCGRFKDAETELTDVLRMDPTDKIALYYKRLSAFLKENGSKADKYLPIKYEADVPDFEKKEREKIIKELMSLDVKQVKAKLKNAKVREALVWGMEKADEKIAQMCVYVYANVNSLYTISVLLEKLLDSEFAPTLKRMIVYLLILGGYDKKIGVITDYFYLSLKPKKFEFLSESEYGGLFVSAYAMAVSKMLYTIPEGFEKLGYSVNKLYKRFCFLSKKSCDSLKEEELAALIVKDSGVIASERINVLTELFKIDSERWQEIIKIVYGEKYGKDY